MGWQSTTVVTSIAADFGFPLVSLDRRQLRAASAEGLNLINVASHPL